jgi:ATP-dependent Zn protease
VSASGIVSDYIIKYGMADNGIRFTRGATGGAYDEEYSRQMERLYAKAKDVIAENIGALERLSAALLEKESLGEGEIDGIVRGIDNAIPLVV